MFFFPAMQVNSSVLFLPPDLAGLCGGDEEYDSPRKVNDSGVAGQNFSLNCWLQFLSKETSLDLHGDSANLVVGVSTSWVICG